MNGPSAVASVLRAAATRLAAAGASSAALDASLLLAHVLGVAKVELRLEPDRELTAAQAAEFDALLRERERRRPMAHLLGRAEFWSRDFLVTRDTLCPRPETEGLVEETLRVLAGRAAPVVVDVGTGTGCIAVTIAAEVPHAVVHATDISGAALAVAKRNAQRHGVEDRVMFHHGAYLAPIETALGPGSVDAVVSNPPYVARSEAGAVDPEVLWEPAAAVFSDGAPASVYGIIARGAAPLVRDGGWLLLELPGDGTDAVVAAVRAAGGWEPAPPIPDLAGLPRVLVAARLGAGDTRN